MGAVAAVAAPREPETEPAPFDRGRLGFPRLLDGNRRSRRPQQVWQSSFPAGWRLFYERHVPRVLPECRQLVGTSFVAATNGRRGLSFKIEC